MCLDAKSDLTEPLGAGAFLVSLVLMVAIVIDTLYVNTALAVGIQALLSGAANRGNRPSLVAHSSCSWRCRWTKM